MTSPQAFGPLPFLKDMNNIRYFAIGSSNENKSVYIPLSQQTDGAKKKPDGGNALLDEKNGGADNFLVEITQHMFT